MLNFTGNIVGYGLKRILVAFISLQIVTLLVTSFFILKPFMKLTSATISAKMIEQLNNSKNTSNTKTGHTKPDNNSPFKLVSKQPFPSDKKTTSSLINNDFYHITQQKFNNSYQFLPVLFFIKQNLQSQLQLNVKLVSIDSQPNIYWFHIEKTKFSIGFSRHLIGTQPELTMVLLLILLTFIATIFSYYISKKLNQPLVTLKEVTHRISEGDFSARLPKQSLIELDEAFEQINQLVYHFEHLLEQRVIFLSGISHDIRTPLTRLKLLIAIHQQDISPQFSDKTNSIIAEMEALIKLYLDSSEYLLESNTEVTVINQFLADIIKQAPSEQSGLVDLHKLSDIEIRINRSALSRVINNLISNSFKYAHPDKTGAVIISLKTQQSYLTVNIADHGKGLPNKEFEAIFKPFFRSNQESKNSKGNGLGLSICRQICLSQGWQIKLADNNPGLVASIKIPYDFSLGHQ